MFVQPDRLNKINAFEVSKDLFEPLVILLEHIAININGTRIVRGNYKADAECFYKNHRIRIITLLNNSS